MPFIHSTVTHIYCFMQGAVRGAGTLALKIQKVYMLSAFMKLTLCGGRRTRIINQSISQ